MALAVDDGGTETMRTPVTCVNAVPPLTYGKMSNVVLPPIVCFAKPLPYNGPHPLPYPTSYSNLFKFSLLFLLQVDGF